MELHLASMENVSCWAFRKLCNGATDSYTGMMALSHLIKRSKAWKEIDTFGISGQRQWVQITGSSESQCKEFLDRLGREIKQNPAIDHIYGIELNVSCPSPNLVNMGHGAALIKRPKKVSAMVSELMKQDKFKIGVKTRIGLNDLDVREKRVHNLLEELEKIKEISHVVVHFKHAREKSFTPYNYELLKELGEFNVPIIINGGINEINDFNRAMQHNLRGKVKGMMIGREALRNPDCFVKISNMLNKTELEKRGKANIKKEFEILVKEHEPKEIYLNTIKQLCPWYK